MRPSPSFCSTLPAAGRTALVEAEQFETLGGWVPDAQFMDEMGYAFLLAHALGGPVEDAMTEAELPEAGTYRVCSAPLKTEGPAGQAAAYLLRRHAEVRGGAVLEVHYRIGQKVT